jgi:hypothetical protein
MWWANLKPRKKQPRQMPGQLFYRAEFSHVFEKYWNHLASLGEHPEVCQESEFTQGRMKHSSSALSRLDLADFTPACRLKPGNRILRPSKMRQSVDCARFKTLRPCGKCTEVVLLQCQTVSRSSRTYTMLLPSGEGSSFSFFHFDAPWLNVVSAEQGS